MAAEEREEMSEQYKPATETWAAQFGKCWRCGVSGIWPLTLTIHHIVRGVLRQKNDLRTTAIACYDCHWREHNGDGIGLIGWLRLKRDHDPENFDLEAINALRGRAPGAITPADLKG